MQAVKTQKANTASQQKLNDHHDGHKCSHDHHHEHKVDKTNLKQLHDAKPSRPSSSVEASSKSLFVSPIDLIKKTPGFIYSVVTKPINWISNLIWGTKEDRIKKSAKENVIEVLDELGQEAIKSAANPKYPDKYILAFGESHIQEPGKEHLSSKWLLNNLEKFKAKGFDTLALELPRDTQPLLDEKDHKVFLEKFDFIDKRKEMRKEWQKKAEEIGFKDPDLIKKLSKEGTQHAQDWQGGLDTAGKSEDDQKKANDAMLEKLGALPFAVMLRLRPIIDKARKLGIKILFFDAPFAIQSQQEFYATLIVGIMKKQQQGKSADKDLYDKLVEEISKKNYEVMSQRDALMADYLTKNLKSGNILMITGALHATNKNLLTSMSSKTALGMIKAKKIPAVGLCCEAKNMFDKVQTKEFSLKTKAAEILDDGSLKQPAIVKIDDSLLANENIMESNKGNVSYGEALDAAIVVPKGY